MKTIKHISFIFFFLLNTLLYPLSVYSQLTVGIGITVRDAPPPLPIYEQPPCPVDGYLWSPGYWAYNGSDYYWVPGAWVYPPEPDYLWTPCYWEFSGGYYIYHAGYWGTNIGYYGGVDYGYGYSGSGYYGGRWERGRFRYNTAVVNVNSSVVRNTYEDRTVIVYNNNKNNHSSYNGPGGIRTNPTRQEESAMRERHVQPTSEQITHQRGASKNRNQFASVNKGHPATPAINKESKKSEKPQIKHENSDKQKTINRQERNNINKPENRPDNRENGKPSNHPSGIETRPSSPPARQEPNRSVQQPVKSNQETHHVKQQTQQNAKPTQRPQTPQQNARPAPRPQTPQQNHNNQEHKQSGEGHDKR